MADICASCAHRVEEEITKGLYGLSCDYGLVALCGKMSELAKCRIAKNMRRNDEGKT